MVTKEELMDLATLSKLNISDDETDKLLKDMEEIIKFADTINSASSEGVAFDNINELQNVYREDNIIKSYAQSEILKNAKTQEDGFFCISNRG
ncbi:MAG: Asp-tRNA(Asn)/Glu-tRNA(Gln) amidotransferase subunit GatC [Oscillospiraceae bacterium]|nr:Asp-tRNA(Asn)/Glu-tRNA(Gln) amidotransferase subunit GatC [Oscillospiraceae bacterium]